MDYELKQLKADFKTITETGENMIKQDNRATQYPLFVIQDQIRKWVEVDADYDERERTEEIKEYFLCNLCHTLSADDKELPPECEMCEEDAFDHYVLEWEFKISQAGVFFTENAIDTHIAENRHHYRNPRSYVISAWRNPEMQALMRQTVNIGGKVIPSHYA